MLLFLRQCEHGVVRGCGLYQSDKNDIDSIKVVTNRFIHDREIITIYMGRLIETEQFEAEYGGRARFHVSSYDIKRESLPTDYTGPDLMLDTNLYANEAKFIRDARWDDHEISANVQCRIVWNHARGIPFVAIVAIGDIAEGAELFVDWGDAAWSTHARGKLHRMAHVSHEQHFRLRQLQQELAKRGVEPYASDVAKRPRITDDVAFEDFHFADDDDEPAPAAASSSKSTKKKANKSTSSSSNVQIRGDEVVNTDTYAAAAASSSPAASSSSPSHPRRLEGIMSRHPPPANAAGTAPTFVLRNTKHVFENCGVELMERCDYTGLSPACTASWVKAAGKNCSVANLKPSLKTVLETGRCPKAAVYEVVSLRHPARFYSPPDAAIYALIARETIEKNEPIGVYVGKVHEAAPFHGDYTPEDRIKQVYAYDMNASLFDGILNPGTAASAAAAASFQVALPDLVCESLSIGGNETRFVNDSWCRRGGTKSKNAEAAPEFDPIHGNMPVMVIRATRRIQKGEEIVTDYGETFWCKISTALCAEHQAFQQKATAQIVDCAKELRKLLEKSEQPGAAAAASSSAAAAASPPAAAAASSTDASPSAAAAAASSAHPASTSRGDDTLSYIDDAIPPPDRWDCYRELYNQFDVRYAHRKPPVRLDTSKHIDRLPAFQAQEARTLRRELREKEIQKLERAKIRAEQAEKKAEQAAKVAALATAPERVNGRASARVSGAALALEEAAKKAAADAEEVAAREKRRAEKLTQAIQDKGRAIASAGAGGSAAFSTAMDIDDDAADDSDVEIISGPRVPVHRSLIVSHQKEHFTCDCGDPDATFRTYKDQTFKCCRDCFKKRCSAILAGVKWRPVVAVPPPAAAVVPVSAAGAPSPARPVQSVTGSSSASGEVAQRPIFSVASGLSFGEAHQSPSHKRPREESESKEEKAYARYTAEDATKYDLTPSSKRIKAESEESKHQPPAEDGDSMLD